MGLRLSDAGRRLGFLLSVLLLLCGSTTSRAQEADTMTTAGTRPILSGPIHDVPRLSFDQEQLRLRLDLDPAAQRLNAEATLILTPIFEPTDTLVLAAHDLAIDSVRAGRLDSSGVRVPVTARSGDSLLVALDTLALQLDEPFRVQLYYTAQPQQGLFFQRAGDAAQIWTEGGPSAARYWFPTLEHPADNITTEIIATVPASHEVVAAGRLVDEREENGRRTVHYIHDQPQTADQVLLASGAFAKVADVMTLPNGRRLPVQVYLPLGRDGTAEPTFGRIPLMLRFFSERLGFPYPWPRFAVAAVRGFHPGIRDGTGVLLIDETLLRDERALLDGTGDAALAEAVARQWIGHVVSPTYWTDRWLVDGLAAYLGALFQEAHAGPQAFFDALTHVKGCYLAEAATYHRPLVWDRWMLPDQMADAHSRCKGAWVIHMLRERLGDEAFWRGLAAFMDQHAFDTADTEAFRFVLEQASGQPLGDFFDQWVYGAGAPILEASYTYDADDEALVLSVNQVQEGDWVREVFEVSVATEIHSLLGVERQDLTLTRREQTVTVPASMRPRFVLLDPDLEVLSTIRLDQPVTAWVAQLRYAPLPQHRLQAAQMLRSFSDDPALLIGLRAALQDETDPGVRAAILHILGALPPNAAAEQLLLTACTEEAPVVRAAALDNLGRYEGSEAAMQCARQRAQADRSYRVQAAAVRALADLNAPDATAIVRSALITPSFGEEIRRAALSVVDSLDLPARERIALLLTHTEADQAPPVRVRAIELLAHHATDRRALNRLMALLDDPHVAIREAAIRALAATSTDRARSALEAHRTTEPHRLLRPLIDTLLASSQEETG